MASSSKVDQLENKENEYQNVVNDRNTQEANRLRPQNSRKTSFSEKTQKS